LFGSLKSGPGWVDSLNHQPVVGRVESDRIIHFDSSRSSVLVSDLKLEINLK